MNKIQYFKYIVFVLGYVCPGGCVLGAYVCHRGIYVQGVCVQGRGVQVLVAGVQGVYVLGEGGCLSYPERTHTLQNQLRISTIRGDVKINNCRLKAKCCSIYLLHIDFPI